MGKQLPLFIDKTELPTGKHHISYSEISDHIECSYRHKLKHIDKISLDNGSIHTCFGKALHDTLEHYVKTKIMKSAYEVKKQFYYEVLELVNEDKRKEALENIEEFSECITDIIEQFPKWIDEEFPGWQLVEAEHYLFEPIEKQTNINFKGYIDLIIKIPVKKNKRHPDGYKYVLMDYKTCSWGWKADQKRDFKKQMQLILYKHFWCRFMGIELTDVSCAFVLLKRVAKKSDNSRIEVVPVSVGEKAVEKALQQVNSSINQIKRGFVTKNRFACEPFCPYKGTEHCL